MVNNVMFDAAQAEVAYRSEQLYATRRNLRIRRLRRRIAQTDAVAATRESRRSAAPEQAPEPARSDPAARSQEKVSAR